MRNFPISIIVYFKLTTMGSLERLLHTVQNSQQLAVGISERYDKISITCYSRFALPRNGKLQDLWTFLGIRVVVGPLSSFMFREALVLLFASVLLTVAMLRSMADGL